MKVYMYFMDFDPLQLTFSENCPPDDMTCLGSKPEEMEISEQTWFTLRHAGHMEARTREVPE